MAALGALGALGGSLRELAMAPVKRWSQTTVFHKILAAGAGAGLAYYLHKRGMTDVAVAVVGLGGAYTASAIMHYPQVMQNGGGSMLGNGQGISGMLPAGRVNDMVAQAQAVMNGNSTSGGIVAGGALAFAAPVGGQQQQQQQQQQQPQPQVVIGGQQQQQSMGAAPRANSKWSALG